MPSTTNPILIQGQPKRAIVFWSELRTTGLLALPIIFGQVMQNSLAVIDTLMVGRVSVDAVAAASLAGAVFIVPLVFGFGLMGPFSVLVSGANARGEELEMAAHLRRGLVVSVVLGVCLAVAMSASTGLLQFLHQPAAVLSQARPFLLLLTWSLVPMYLFQTLKQFCEALHLAWLPMVILMGGVCLNVALSWLFIFGHCGVPAQGLLGAGFSTFISRTTMLAVLGLIMAQVHSRAPALRHALIHGRSDWKDYRGLLEMGLPAGFQVILEVGAFSFGAIMMGWISEAALAAHQVAISIAATIFMVPLGLSMAVAIRISHAIGSHDVRRARACAQGALLITFAYASFAAVIICLFAHDFAAAFIHDHRVVLIATQVLFIAGLFQIFDATQIVCVGALRGLHDIKFPFLLNLFGYWAIALPLAYVFAFKLDWGPQGVWIGLLIGLAIAAVVFVLRLKQKLDKAAALPPSRSECPV